MKCEQCAFEFFGDGAKFCPKCGSPLPTLELSEPEAKMSPASDDVSVTKLPSESEELSAHFASEEEGELEAIDEESVDAPSDTDEKSVVEVVKAGGVDEVDASSEVGEEPVDEKSVGGAGDEELGAAEGSVEEASAESPAVTEKPNTEEQESIETADKKAALIPMFDPILESEPEQQSRLLGPTKKKLILAGGVTAALVLVIVALVMFLPRGTGLSFAERKALEGAAVGDVLTLGAVTYTDNAGSKITEKVEWRVLATEEDRVLVISEEILDVRPYNTQEVATSTWEESEIRNWLNGEFYNGLSEFILENIQVTQVEERVNSDYAIPGGADTEDAVFLLSIDEATTYFSTDKERQVVLNSSRNSFRTVVSDYSRESSEVAGFVETYGTWPWWVRSSGIYGDTAFAVDFDGVVYQRYSDFEAGIRPAFWLTINQE